MNIPIDGLVHHFSVVVDETGRHEYVDGVEQIPTS